MRNRKVNLFILATISVLGLAFFLISRTSLAGPIASILPTPEVLRDRDPVKQKVSNPARLTADFEDTGISFVGLQSGDAAWGDYDNDGDLDLLMSGCTFDNNVTCANTLTMLNRNDGNRIFTIVNAGLKDVYGGSLAWGDYDNDEDLDILITGVRDHAGHFAIVYRNDGNSVFTDIHAPLTGVMASSVDWGDYDNDGDLDILLTGRSRANPVSKIYRNDRNGIFTDIRTSMVGLAFSSASWGDYDGDGDLDVLMSGFDGWSFLTKLYKNDGKDSFLPSDVPLADVNWGGIDWGDYDSDGDLDILVVGNDSESNCVEKIYRNDGDGIFTDIEAVLDCQGSVWGDYDSDGDLDILGSGVVLRNDGNNIFTTHPIITEKLSGNTAWGDYDNDGDLDILLTAGEGQTRVSKIYSNNLPTKNSAPGIPPGLRTTIVGEDILFQWDTAADAQTPSSGLFYSLRIGTTPGGADIRSPMADSSTGFRHLQNRVNAREGLAFSIKNLPSGTYFWSIQAVDSSWSGSPFAGEKSFTVAKIYLPHLMVSSINP